MKKTSLLWLGLCAALAGCAMNVQTVNPRPNVNIDKSAQTIALTLGTQVQNEFQLVNPIPIQKAAIHGWQQTLTNGFNNGFGDSYKVTDKLASADLVLTIKKADPEFALTAYTTLRNGSMANAAFEARITYAADLATRDGKVVGRSAGTVRSKKTAMSSDEMPKSLESAVESMYEAIATEAFKTK